MWEKVIVDVVFGVFFGFILGFKYSDFYNLACILYLIVLTSLFRQPNDLIKSSSSVDRNISKYSTGV